jgi:hypothetical protein
MRLLEDMEARFAGQWAGRRVDRLIEGRDPRFTDGSRGCSAERLSDTLRAVDALLD